MRRKNIISTFIFIIFLSLAIPAIHIQAEPQKGTYFNYDEYIQVSDGKGNYSGYYSNAWVNGTESVTQLLHNDRVSMNYNYSCAIRSSDYNYFNNQMAIGNFTFSAYNCNYTYGTDNETGYINPHVWFFTNVSIPVNSEKEVLNTKMKVVSTDYSYSPGGTNGQITTIFLQGNGTYVRNDSYGTFNATYTWNAYYDRSSGFIVAYDYKEVDSNGQGDGFACSNSLYVKDSSYGVSISPTHVNPKKSSPFPYFYLAIALVFILALIVIIALVISNGNKNKIKKHSTNGGNLKMTENNEDKNKTEIHLNPESKETEQVVIKEVVKVKCQYCGALIDSTAEKCPYCGAPRN